MSAFTQFSALLLGLAVFFAPYAPQEFRTTEQLRARYVRETDPVRQAKMLSTLGESEFKDAESALAADNLPEAAGILELYVSEAQACEKSLHAKHPDPEKHSKGYKLLQISIRESLRRLNSIIVGLAGDERTPFVNIRGQLDEMDRHLIQELFPTQPAAHAPAKAKG